MLSRLVRNAEDRESLVAELQKYERDFEPARLEEVYPYFALYCCHEANDYPDISIRIFFEEDVEEMSRRLKGVVPCGP